MIIRHFSATQFPIIASWLHKRELPTNLVDTLPTNGFVIYSDDRTGVAAGFIRKVEGGWGMIDGYLTNPDIAPNIRDEALNILTEKLLQHAKTMGISQLFAFSTDKNTITRSQQHGFQRLNHVVIVAELSAKGT